MNPLDFIAIAEKLADAGMGEAAFRSAISRAYYGAFHCCREGIPRDLIPSKDTMRKEGSHKAVLFALEAWGRSTRDGRTDAAIAARKLGKLRLARVIADYKLAEAHGDPMDCIEVAREVSACIERASKRDDELS